MPPPGCAARARLKLAQAAAERGDPRREVLQGLGDEIGVTGVEVFRRAQRRFGHVQQQALARRGLGQGTVVGQAQVPLEPDNASHGAIQAQDS